MSRLVLTSWGTGHSYSLDGERVPGVTTITRTALANDGLKWAAAKHVARHALTHRDSVDVLGEDAWVREAERSFDVAWKQSALAGSQVHDMARRMVFGAELDAKDPETGEAYPDQVYRMGQQVARFMDTWDVREDAVVEAPVFHEELRYAGTLDLLCSLRDGRKWLLDFKTGAGVYQDAAYQLAGYRYATHIQVPRKGGTATYDLLMPPVDRTGVVWVRPDGWQLIPVDTREPVWETFTHMVHVQRHVAETAPSKQHPRGTLLGEPLPDPGAVA